jgi:hypothetical protein
MVIRILLVVGIFATIISFTANPFSKKPGLLIVVLGIIAGFIEGPIIGVPLMIMGALLLLIYFLYHYHC